MDQDALRKPDLQVPSLIVGRPVAGQTPNVYLDPAGVAVVEPVLLLRDALSHGLWLTNYL